MAMEALDTPNIGGYSQDEEAFLGRAHYVQELWKDGYQFGDIIRSFGRLFKGSIDEANMSPEDFEAAYGEGGSLVTPEGEEIPGSVVAFNSDANSFGQFESMSAMDKLKWLIQNDPDNATGWIQALTGMQGERENIQDARAFQEYMDNTKYQRAAKDLEAAGINPILAYQYVNGSGSGTGAAGVPSIDTASTEATRNANKNTVSAQQRGNNMKLAAVIGAIIGVILKAVL